MTRFIKLLLAAIVAVAATAPLQSVQARAPYTQAELDQMLAPIALYPDALLSQILLAATQPLEVVEAARWSRANPGIQGDDAVRAVQQEDWDPSVKSLVAFPQLLARMDERLEWTEALGDAFFVQEPVVMETIQELRRRARAAGQLVPDERLRVYDEGPAIVIEPVTPEVVYVPYYDPWIVYGPWWWSAYPPVAWAPWPGYAVARRPGVSPGFWWGPGIGISIGFMYGSVDWFHRRVHVPVHSGYRRPTVFQRDSRSRRVAPESIAPAPRLAPRPQPRAERPYPRRDARSDAISAEPRRVEPRAPAAIELRPRLRQRAVETSQPAVAAPAAPARREHAPRMEAPRIERVRQAPPAQIPPQRIERTPQAQPQATQAPRAQARAAQAQRAQPPPSQAARVEQAHKAAPQRAEAQQRREAREARDGAPRGFARP